MRLASRREPAVTTVVAALFLVMACTAARPAASGEEERAPLDVPYVSTPQPVVDTMLEMAAVTKDDVVYDLGSGDGRIVVTAASRYGARGVGIDLDPARIEDGRRNAEAAGVGDRVRFVQQDLFVTDLREATVVTMYLLQAVNLRLRPKLLEQLDPGDRIVSHAFDLGDWEPDRTAEVDRGDGRRSYVYAWIVPAHAAGTWDVTLHERGRSRSLRVSLEQKYQKLEGAARLDGQEVPIEQARLAGDRITFTVRDGSSGRQRALTFLGRVDGARMAALPAAEQGAGRSGAAASGGDNTVVPDWSAVRRGPAPPHPGSHR